MTKLITRRGFLKVGLAGLVSGAVLSMPVSETSALRGRIGRDWTYVKREVDTEGRRNVDPTTSTGSFYNRDNKLDGRIGVDQTGRIFVQEYQDNRTLDNLNKELVKEGPWNPVGVFTINRHSYVTGLRVVPQRNGLDAVVVEITSVKKTIHDGRAYLTPTKKTLRYTPLGEGKFVIGQPI